MEFGDITIPQSIKILAVGYETLIKKVTPSDTKISVYLPPQSVELEGLEVVAERVPDKTSKVTFKSDELISTPGTQGDPIKILDSLPGVVAAAEGSGAVYMRGSGLSDNIVWVNNVPIGYLYHWDGLQSTINPSLVSDLNIFLGGFPVEYGDALGGAIDVTLRAPKKDRQHYNVHLGTYKSGFLIEGPIGETDGKNSFFLAARRSYIDFLLSPTDFTDFINDDEENLDQFITVPQFYDIQGLARHELNNGNLDAYYFSAGDKLAFENNEDAKTDPQLSGKMDTKTSFQTMGLMWRQQWNNKWDTTIPLALYRMKEKLIMGADDQGNPFFGNILQEKILWQPEVRWQRLSTPLDNYANAGTGEAYGVDVYIKREKSKGKMGWLSYSYAKSKRKNEFNGVDRNYSGDQPHTVTLVWGQPFAGSWKAWTWGIKIKAHSGNTYTPITGHHREDPADNTSRWIPEYAEHNSRRTPPYYRLDVRFERAVLFNKSKMKFYIEILNATNRKNVVGYDYGDEYEKIDHPSQVASMPIFPF